MILSDLSIKKRVAVKGRRPIYIDGTWYETMSEARENCGIPYKKMMRRLNNPKDFDIYYKGTE